MNYKLSVDITETGLAKLNTDLTSLDINLSRAKAGVKSAVAGTNELSSEAREASASLAGMGSNTNRLSSEAQNASSSMSGLQSSISAVVTAGAGLALLNFSKNIIAGAINARAEMESLERVFGAIGGTARQLDQVKAMAVDTPAVDTKGAIAATSAFARMGNTISDSIEKTRLLANGIAYFGGSAQQVDQAIIQMEQLAGKTSGFGDDLRALRNSMPGVAALIQEAFNVKSLDELSEKGITGQQVIDGLLGKLGELPKLEAGTAESLQSVQASFAAIAATVGTAFVPALTATANLLTDLSAKIEEMPPWKKDLAAWALGLGAVAGAGVLVVNAIKNMVAMTKALTAAKTAENAVEVSGNVAKTTSWGLTKLSASAYKAEKDALIQAIMAKSTNQTLTWASVKASAAATIATIKETAQAVIQTATIWALNAALVVKNALSGPAGWAILAGAAVVATGAIIGINKYKKNAAEEEAQKKRQAEAGVEASKAKGLKKEEADKAQKLEEEQKRAADIEKATVPVRQDRQILAAEQSGDMLTASKIRAEKSYMTTLDEIQKKEKEQGRTLEEERALAHEQYIADCTAADKAYADEQQKNREKELQEIEKASKEAATAYKKGYDTVAKTLGDSIKKREDYTKTVLAEAQKEREGLLGVYSKGQMAVASSGYINTDMASTVDSASILRAKATIDAKKSNEANLTAFTDRTLFGNSTEQLRAGQKDAENMSKWIEANSVYAGQQVGLLAQLYQSMNGLYNLALQDMQ